MTTSREAAVVALSDACAATGAFKSVSRRNRDTEGIGPDESPALFLMQMRDSYHVQSPSMPPRVCLHVWACIYDDAGNDPNVVPTTALNDALDALDVILRKIDPATGRNTLGGLVYSLMPDGDVDRIPGDKEGKTLAVVPLAIILP